MGQYNPTKTHDGVMTWKRFRITDPFFSNITGTFFSQRAGDAEGTQG